MPVDPINDNTTPAAQSNGAATPTAQYVTQEQFTAFAREIGKQMQSGFGQIAQRLAPPVDPNANAGASDDPAREMLADPKGFMAKQFDENYRAKLGGLENVRITERYQENMQALRSEFDGRFGPGTFDTEVLPEIEQSIAALPNPQGIQVSSTALRQLAQMVQGQKFESLVERQRKHAETKAKEQSVRPEAPMMMPNGWIPPKQNELSADELELVKDSTRRGGIDWNRGPANLKVLMPLRDAMLSGKFDTGRGWDVAAIHAAQREAAAAAKGNR